MKLAWKDIPVEPLTPDEKDLVARFMAYMDQYEGPGPLRLDIVRDFDLDGDEDAGTLVRWARAYAKCHIECRQRGQNRGRYYHNYRHTRSDHKHFSETLTRLWVDLGQQLDILRNTDSELDRDIALENIVDIKAALTSMEKADRRSQGFEDGEEGVAA
jgi:hypothetical protein